MQKISFRLSIVNQTPPRPAKSPCCGSGCVVHQRKRRGLDDTRIGEVEVVRYRCKACGKTFTVRPQGVTQSSKSLRVQGLVVMMWCLGLSYDAVLAILEGLGVPLGKGTACGYVLRAGAEAKRLRAKAKRGQVRFAGMDTTVYKVKGRKVVAAYVTDALRGDTVAIEFVDGEDAESLAKVLRKATADDLELLVTDDAGPYGQVAESVGCEHNLCNTHFKKAFANRVKRILADTPEDHPRLGEIKSDLDELRRYAKRGSSLSVRLVTAAKRLLPGYLPAPPPRKGGRASPEYRVRLLLTDLADHGLRLFAHRSRRGAKGRYKLDGTNNVTERAIGLDGKWRYRSMRGAKSKRALRNVLNLQAYIRQRRLAGDGPLDVAHLLAA